METKKFGLRTILSVTTGRLLTEPEGETNGIGKMYDLLGWLHDDIPYTHSLGLFADTGKPWLLKCFPELKAAGTKAALTRLDARIAAIKKLEKPVETSVHRWIAELRKQHNLPAFYDVPRLPGQRLKRDPIADLDTAIRKAKAKNVKR